MFSFVSTQFSGFNDGAFDADQFFYNVNAQPEWWQFPVEQDPVAGLDPVDGLGVVSPDDDMTVVDVGPVETDGVDAGDEAATSVDATAPEGPLGDDVVLTAGRSIFEGWF